MIKIYNVQVLPSSPFPDVRNSYLPSWAPLEAVPTLALPLANYVLLTVYLLVTN